MLRAHCRLRTLGATHPISNALNRWRIQPRSGISTVGTVGEVREGGTHALHCGGALLGSSNGIKHLILISDTRPDTPRLRVRTREGPEISQCL